MAATVRPSDGQAAGGTLKASHCLTNKALPTPSLSPACPPPHPSIPPSVRFIYPGSWSCSWSPAMAEACFSSSASRCRSFAFASGWGADGPANNNSQSSVSGLQIARTDPSSRPHSVQSSFRQSRPGWDLLFSESENWWCKNQGNLCFC